MAENKLTVIIPCKNERKNIRGCIESIRPVADEILVADSGSTDGTLEMVREMGGVRVIEREYVHSGDFKNWAIPQATHDWVMIIDADERVAEPLAEEIRCTLRSPRCDGYWIFRENHFMGHRIRFSGWQSDKVLRLFRRDLGRYLGENDHAEVQISSENVGQLGRRLQHFTYWSYDQYFQKMHRYTAFQAHVWYRSGRRPSTAKLLFNGPFRFLYAYIVRLGFLDGLPGIQVCLLTGVYSFLKQARLWELYHARPQPDSDRPHRTGRESNSKAA